MSPMVPTLLANCPVTLLRHAVSLVTGGTPVFALRVARRAEIQGGNGARHAATSFLPFERMTTGLHEHA